MGTDFVRSLHGFTHSGLEQIVNRIDNALESTPYNYPESSVTALLDLAGRFTVMAAMISAQAVEGNASEVSSKVELLQERFNQLRRAYSA